MDTISAKVLLKSWFETGDAPTESQFNDIITSLTGAVTDDIDESDVVDGILTIDYGTVSVEVSGAEVAVDIEITNPLFCIISPQTDGNETIIAPVTRITSKQCTVNIGSDIKAGAYKYYLIYNE